MKLLLVDDSRAMRLIVRRTLREAGFGHHDIAEAEDGQAALEHVRKEHPDVVLSDWNMPRMTGIQLLRALNDDGIRVRFGFVTSEGTKEIGEAAEAAGALFLITKPFTPEDFQQALTPLIGPPKARA